MQLSEIEKARFWSKMKAVKGNSKACWLWEGAKSRDGYAIFASKDERYAHRISYQLLVGSIPLAYEVDHLCRVRNCINPEHLEAVTRHENNARKVDLITHCPKGHPYNEVNTYHHGNARFCRVCRKLLAREERARA